MVTAQNLIANAYNNTAAQQGTDHTPGMLLSILDTDHPPNGFNLPRRKIGLVMLIMVDVELCCLGRGC